MLLGDRRITQRKIAEDLGLSPAVVSLTLRNPGTSRASEATKRKIRNYLRSLAEAPEEPGSAKQRTVLYLTSSGGPDYYFSQALLSGAQARAAELGYRLELLNVAQDIKGAMERADVSGALISHYELATPELAELCAGRPAITLNAFQNGGFIGDAVLYDHFSGMLDAIREFQSQGHERVGYLGYVPDSGYLQNSRYRERFNDFLNACETLGLKASPESCQLIRKERASAELRQLVRSALEAWKRKPKASRPTALMVFNDLMAAQLLNAALALGVGIPGELSVAGFDNEPLCQTLSPELSSVSPEFRQMGVTGVELLHAGATPAGQAAGRKLLTPVKFVRRESVGKPL
jgi:DNA-binding LacI/PurR family transcriptional regulator